jgi:hypothetical protein
MYLLIQVAVGMAEDFRSHLAGPAAAQVAVADIRQLIPQVAVLLVKEILAAFCTEAVAAHRLQVRMAALAPLTLREMGEMVQPHRLLLANILQVEVAVAKKRCHSPHPLGRVDQVAADLDYPPEPLIPEAVVEAVCNQILLVQVVRVL